VTTLSRDRTRDVMPEEDERAVLSDFRSTKRNIPVLQDG
jgi:hypothetical protein